MDTEEWQEVMVPAELMALGYDIRRDKEYVYKRQLDIPKEWQGSTLILKFSMVYEYCKIWVNGKFVREHEGAFTSFECDITDYVIFGQTAIITVMCMHRHDALCDWTAEPGTEVPGYAGLIDDVILAVLPGMHLKRLIYDTELDDAYANAVLKVTAELAQAPETENGQQISAKLRLLDTQSRNILSENCRLYFKDDFAKLELAVANPLKWCAEHPNLYRLEVILQSENGMPLAVRVENRYNNTNLQDILFRWSVGEERGECYGPVAAPFQTGALLFPVRDWKEGETLCISAYEKNGFCADSYELKLTGRMTERVIVSGKRKTGILTVTNSAKEIQVAGEDFSVSFSKKTGLIRSGCYKGTELIIGGPYLNLYGAYYKPSVFQNDRRGSFCVDAAGWKCDRIQYAKTDEGVLIKIDGTYPGAQHYDMWQFEYGYDEIRVHFEIGITVDGEINTTWSIQNPPREVLFECGVSYILNDQIDKIRWKKESVYSAYPEDHIGRPEGEARRYRGFGQDQYRIRPQWRWSQDETNYALYDSGDKGGHGTNDFIASRENIRYYDAMTEGSEEFVRVESEDASVAVRACPAQDENAEFPQGIKLTINNYLYYDLGNGSSAIVKSGDGYLGNHTYPEIRLDDDAAGTVRIRLTAESKKNTKWEG